MQGKPLFQRPSDGASITIFVDGQPLKARPNDSVAAAVATAGLDRTRTSPITDEPRAAYCMMGVCFECLMIVDGQPSQQTCQILVREGMKVECQIGWRPLS